MKITKDVVVFPVIALVIADTLVYISWSGNASGLLVNTVIAVFRYTALYTIVAIYNKTDRKNDIPTNISLFMSAIVFWQIVTLIKGVILARDYWDWKFLLFESTLFLFVPLSFYVGKTILFFKTACAFAVKYIFRYGFVLIPLALATNQELYARIMIPTSIIIILIPFFERKWRILILIVSAASILVEPGFRTNIIKIVTSLGILGSYYFRHRISFGWIRVAFYTLFLLPVVLTILAYSTGYNVFAEVLKEDDKYEFNDKNGEVQNLASDTRTFLYQEVVSSLVTNGTLVMGEGASGKYQTAYFDEHGTGRYGSEVGFLNVLLYSGIIGIVLYVTFLVTVSYYAIYRSNNWLSKMFGILVAVRWVLFFIEEFTQFDLNFYFFWLVLGLISSQKFRLMNDDEIKEIFSFSL